MPKQSESIRRVAARQREEAEGLWGRMPPVRQRPLVSSVDLREIVRVFEALPTLRYPIDTAADLLEQLGGEDATVQLAGIDVRVARMIGYLRAYYFPISSVENFIEKLAEVIRTNRPSVDISTEVPKLKQSLGDLKYPIADSADLARQSGGEDGVAFRRIDGKTAPLLTQMPEEFFPVESEEDLDRSLALALLSRPLISPHESPQPER